MLDIDDNAPRFPQPSYEASVKEGYVPGTPLITMEAVDPDQSSILSYSIITGDAFHHFMITSAGEVFVIQPLDRERQEQYQLTVSATDGTASATTTLLLKVLDVNIHRTATSPPLQKSSQRMLK